jgi:PAS domain S-box-containing protein
MARLIREVDWSATPLGPIHLWPQSLRGAVQIMLDAPQIASLAVGPERVFIYNDHASRHYGDLHPGALGRPMSETFGPGYDQVAPYYARAFDGEGLSVMSEALDVAADGNVRDFDAWLTPIRDEQGKVIAVLTTGVVLSELAAAERARAHDARRRSEERLRQFGEESQDVLWIRDAEKLKLRYLNPAFEKTYGLSREEALKADKYEGWLDFLLPEDRETTITNVEKVRAGEHVTYEFRIVRSSDGAVRWLRNTDFPITDREGNVIMIGGIGHDVTDSLETERRLKTLVEGMPQLLWRSLNEGEWTWASPQWEDYTGQGEKDYQGQGWLDAVHPDDRERARKAWQEALGEGGFEVEYRIRNVSTGQYHWFQTRAAPVRDSSGNIVEWLGTSTDIDEMHRLQETQKTLLAELQHRVRNILSMVRALVRGSSNSPHESIEDFVGHLVGRLDAMARTQVVLTRAAGSGIDLENLVRDELQVHAPQAARWSIKGPSVILSAKAAEALTLAIHELATNSVKYGVLSDGGSLSVSWRKETRDDAEWVDIRWEETGLSRSETEISSGFGSELVEKRVPYELHGEASLEIKPEGAKARIAFPLNDLHSILETGPGGAVS